MANSRIIYITLDDDNKINTNVKGDDTLLYDLRFKLKQLREEHHFSQKIVASRLGCSVSIISSYETGERLPSLSNLVALSRLYHVSTDYLLGKTDNTREYDFETLIDIDGLNEQQIKALMIIITDMKRSNSIVD